MSRLDARVLAYVETRGPVHVNEVRQLDGGGPAMRRLHKQGRVDITTLGWVSAAVVTCEHCGGTGQVPR